jgi:hypothetical protein
MYQTMHVPDTASCTNSALICAFKFHTIDAPTVIHERTSDGIRHLHLFQVPGASKAFPVTGNLHAKQECRNY